MKPAPRTRLKGTRGDLNSVDVNRFVLTGAQSQPSGRRSTCHPQRSQRSAIENVCRSLSVMRSRGASGIAVFAHGCLVRSWVSLALRPFELGDEGMSQLAWNLELR